MAGRLLMTDALNRILVIIWTKLAALLQPGQGGSRLLSLSLDSADWYQSCTFLAQKGQMKGGRGKRTPIGIRIMQLLVF